MQFNRIAVVVLLSSAIACAQSAYTVIPVRNGGTITGTVKWSGPEPHISRFPITKDPQICDPESQKTADLERLIIGSNGGVANAVIYLKDISKGKPLEIPEARRFLDQRRCHYEPHILIVAENSNLNMKSSDATLHTIHMEGAATYNLPFPFAGQVIARPMPAAGLATLRCNGGHVWMNAEMFVVTHPYYAVTDEKGYFELKDVPPGEYELVAWHEGWKIAGRESMHDVLTQQLVQRPVFTSPRTWEKHIVVPADGNVQVDFTIAE